MTWFTDRLREHAERLPSATAVVALEPPAGAIAEIDFAGLWNAAQNLSTRLRSELPPGSAVLLCAPNSVEYIVAFVAALLADCRVFPVHPNSAQAELHTCVQRAGVRAAMATPDTAELVRPLGVPVMALVGLSIAPPTAEFTPGNGAGLLLQSSGTTGLPKLVYRTAASLDSVARNVADAVGHGADDRVLAAIPLSHSYGIENGLLSPLAAASCVFAARRFEPELALREIQERRITILPGVPFFYEVLGGFAGAQTRLTTLRRAYSAGAALPRTVFDAMRERTGVVVSQLYGATEIGSVTFADPDNPHFDPASVGPGMNGVGIRILDTADPRLDRPLPSGVPGQVAIQSPCRFSEYLGQADTGVIDGFFLTGDLGRLDDHGALTITGRLKLLIDVAGMKVNPLEVEAVLAAHPAVAECVVTALAVSPTVNRLKAVIVLRPGAAPADDELRAFVRGKLAAYKIPRVFEVRDSLPKSPTGKVLRQKLQSS